MSFRAAIYTWAPSADAKGTGSTEGERHLAEAYIESILSAGWVCLPERYDDIGDLPPRERPALNALLADIRAKKVNAVFVSHVDRISERFPDFMDVVREFEEHNVLVVSLHLHKQILGQKGHA